VTNSAYPPHGTVVDAVTRALAEDLTPLGDVTSAVLPEGLTASAAFVPRAAGILAGRACVIEWSRGPSLPYSPQNARP
jgi:nicotinate-nucleotide pyrophosphorylase (carboxylating)